MATTRIVVDVPDRVVEDLRQASRVLNLSVEEMLANVISASVPDLAGLPPDVRAELVRLTWLPDSELQVIATSLMTRAGQRRLDQLSSRREPLTPAEQLELDDLIEKHDRLTLLKSRAFALLAARSGRALTVGS